MYLIIVYDAMPKRGVKLLKYLRQHLIWVQNSVFEGEVTESEFEIIKKNIKEIINLQKDSVVYYTFDSQNYHERGVIGVERNEIDSFI
jgi:CRISPR-associated protein Cas2